MIHLSRAVQEKKITMVGKLELRSRRCGPWNAFGASLLNFIHLLLSFFLSEGLDRPFHIRRRESPFRCPKKLRGYLGYLLLSRAHPDLTLVYSPCLMVISKTRNPNTVTNLKGFLFFPFHFMGEYSANCIIPSNNKYSTLQEDH